MSEGFDTGILVPLVAIVGGLTIPITAIVMDFRRRRLQFEERRAMIDKGMVPPPLEEDRSPWGPRWRDPAFQRARSLRTGVIMLMLGIGMAVAFCVQQYYVSSDTIMWHGPRWGLAIAASIVGFLGLGNLIYYAVSGKKES
jgi:hypothetical protein